MVHKHFILELADVKIPCEFLYEETARYFGDYCKKTTVENSGVRIPEWILRKQMSIRGNEMSEEFWEYSLLVTFVSNALLCFSRCVFHGLAFVWNNKAYIFTAPSGTGKTTQYIMWKRKCENEVQILNGDKPILEVCEDGTVMVHPSPWKGKERMSGHQKVQLGGIVLLRQGEENKIRKMTPKEAVLPLLRQFFFTAEKAETVHQVCAFEEALLNRIPVWELINRGDEESVQLTYDTLLEHERELQ